MVGVSRAMPISTGLQLVGTALMGVICFGEWASASSKILGFAAIAQIILGVYFTTYHEDKASKSKDLKAGLTILLISTIGYVGYSFFPRAGAVNGKDAFLAQAIGMVAMALTLSLFVRGGRPLSTKSVLNILGGLVFAIAALGYLFSAQKNGVAVGFTLTQMNVIVATLGSIFVLGEKKTPREMKFVIAGLLIVVAGGVMIGLIPK